MGLKDNIHKRETEKMSEKSFKMMTFTFKIVDFIFRYIGKRVRKFGKVAVLLRQPAFFYMKFRLPLKGFYLFPENSLRIVVVWQGTVLLTI